MNKPTFLALTLLTSATLALPLVAQAQQTAASDSAATKATAKKTVHRAKKPVHKTKKGVPIKTAKSVEAQTPAQTLTERLTDAELATAKEIYTGTFPCELGEHVTVTADVAHQGFFTVTSGNRNYYMHPVESRTGAIRMEDNRLGAVWLQLGSKSMLMDQKLGQRVADDCQAEAQEEYVAHMKDHPQHQLLDNGQSAQQPPAGAASAPVAHAVPAAPAVAASGGQLPAAPDQAASAP